MTTWAAPSEVGATIFTPGGAAAAPSLTAMSGGRALLAWVGQMGGAYTSVYAPGERVVRRRPAHVGGGRRATKPGARGLW